MMPARSYILATIVLIVMTVGTYDAASLHAKESESQTRQNTENAQAHDAYLQGWAHYKLLTPKDLARAIPFFEEALRLDPNYTQVHAALASLYWDVYQNDWAYDLGMPSSRAESRANEHLETALKNPVPLAHVVQSRMFAALGFADEAVVEAEMAVALDGNDATALAGLADALVKADRPAEGLAYIEKAMGVDPYHPPSYLITLGATQFGMANFADAASTFERAVKHNPDTELPLIYVAASYGHLGRIADGDSAIETANDLRAGYGMGELSLERKSSDGFSPFQGEIDFNRMGGKSVQERLRAGLSKIPLLTWQYRITISKPAFTGGAYDVLYEVDGVTEIDIEAAISLYDRGALFIDVSNKEAWSQGHIPRAVHLPYGRSKDSNKERFREKSLRRVAHLADEIVLHCYDQSSCSGSAFAAAKAANWGYQKVYTFFGGAKAWKEAGYPIVTGR
jgi:Tfp pilus assembly protein PilF/rhodanese-related sulfurtransferase